jgi:hypothetical protein
LQSFPASLAEIGVYTKENAEDWAISAPHLRQIVRFAATRVPLAEDDVSTRSGGKRCRSASLEHHTVVKQELNSDPIELSSDSDSDSGFGNPPAPQRSLKNNTSKRHRQNKVIDLTSDGEKAEQPKLRSRPSKRLRQGESNDELSNGSVSTEKATDEAVVRITRQLRVERLIRMTNVPSTWDVPRRRGEFAYLVDLTEDTGSWMKNGKQLSMASMIKGEVRFWTTHSVSKILNALQDHDSWQGGSGGSVNKPTNVIALGNTPCRVVEHVCGGSYHCSELDPALLESCQRFEPDLDETLALFNAERDINAADTSSVIANAAS